MNRGNLWFRAGRVRLAALILAAIASVATVPEAGAGERQFLVMLAYAPKQFRNEDGVPGTPPDGLTNKELIRKQYFDVSSPSIGSFAEYWKEISYGDVTINGDVVDWIELPWSTEPESVEGISNTPANFLNLNGDLGYTYGAGEAFDNGVAAIRIDTDGDPDGLDNGPHGLGPGAADTSPESGLAVWMPGERFVDMDEDGRWDGLDEANNQMDWDGDGAPDLLGPWIDLNDNGEPNNDDNCLYLADDDNDGNPNCCPNGPGRPGCSAFDSRGDLDPLRCPATVWEGPGSSDWQDCNGNLIPDACDVSCVSTDCLATGWLQRAVELGLIGSLEEAGPPVCGASLDVLPYQSGDVCEPDPDGTPDECQFLEFNEPLPQNRCIGSEITDTEDPCSGRPVCTELDPPIIRLLSQRCEFHDVNENGEMDIVEPWENFLRRWDPCLSDPDTRHVVLLSGPVHWIKVYDPTSPSAGQRMDCNAVGSTPADYGDPSYIEDNYPGHADVVIRQAEGREIQGLHDPLGKLPSFDCQCANGEDCDFLTGLCHAGVHDQYDPPDLWRDAVTNNGPGGTTVATTKMRIVGGPIPVGSTPEPGWYEQAWSDRYVGGPDHPLRGDPVVGSDYRGCQEDGSESFDTCEVPDWPGGVSSSLNVPLVELFDDVDPETFDPVVNGNRRYFQANRGGLNADGTGWIGCDSNFDPAIWFETGLSSANVFDVACDHPILPEEVNGASQPGIFYDGWVEHDDLPSSKYHAEGDQRLGEVTSPFNANIWGGGFVAAGPYATGIHGNFGAPSGNLLTLELLTWRTQPPFNNGFVWEQQHGWHRYAGPATGNIGFRDYNLDGLIDQGEVRHPGSENYSEGPGTFVPSYPFHPRRLVEDCVEVLDAFVDFDDWLDPVSLDAVSCHTAVEALKPAQYLQDRSQLTLEPDGLVSGVVLVPSGSNQATVIEPTTVSGSRAFQPIHTQDGDNPDLRFPKNAGPFDEQLRWDLFFHDFVVELAPSDLGVNDYQKPFAAQEYLRKWEDFPTLYDTGRTAPINMPIGRWDIMGGDRAVPITMVHSIPILKEKPCTEWIKPIDLTAVLTPGVEAVITLPPGEFVRDGFFFLENPTRLGERLYFWSAALGFDRPGAPNGGMPGTGMLILHTDVGSNPEALPPGQETATRFTYVIEQADGLEELDAGDNPGDAGDPWPGSTGNTRFNFDTTPSARWYAQNSWTGLDITDIVTDGFGSALISLKWVPTTIPSLSFTDPPGGSSVGSTYQVRVRATDVHGGTTINVFYTDDETDLTIQPGEGNLVGTREKTTPGTNDLSMDWNIAGVPDGRYWFFAELLPGAGADGRTEERFTTPRPGRNNVGEGSLTVNDVNLTARATRLETWIARLYKITDSTTQKWLINATLTQPESDENILDPDFDPDPQRVLEVPVGGSETYESPGGEVRFTINNDGANFAVGDSWSFVTTGVTALSASVTITDGKITEGPIASITADRVSGLPPLTVNFDGRESEDPDGAALSYVWDFGDGSPAGTGAQVTHTYTKAGTFTVTLIVVSELTGLFNETSIDIEVTNNKPTAKMTATPTSGPAPLTVKFNGAGSADTETASDDLIYQWDFGDGATANNAGAPGVFINTDHFYSKKADGTTCTSADPCMFVATLTVTDEGGKQGVATVEIQVGNSFPVANISHSALQGPAPLEVIFNAENSTDADGDDIMVEWDWGDGTDQVTKAAADGAVSHTFEDPGRYDVSATLDDGRGGVVKWPGVTVVVSEPVEDSSTPHAIFTVTPETQLVGEPIEVNAENSFDRPAGDLIASYSWDWGDGTPLGSGVKATHVYDQVRSYTIILTVTDGEDPPNTDSTSRTVSIVGELDELPGPANRAPAARFIVSGGPVNPNEGIAGETVFTFDATSSSDPDGDDLKFDWFFDDDTSIVDGPAVVTHQFDAARTYLVQLTVRDEDNLATNTTQVVIVRDTSLNQDPVALITTGVRSGAVPLAIEFTSELSYDPDGDPLLGYAWYVSDGTNEIRLQVDEQGSWQGTFTGDMPEDATDEDLPVTICHGENRGARIFWTNVDCAARPNGTEDIDIRPSSNNGATLNAIFRSEGTFLVSLEVTDGVAVGRGDAERVFATARGEAPVGGGEEEPAERPETGGGGGLVPSGGICGFGILIGIFGSLFGLTIMMAAHRRRTRFL